MPMNRALAVVLASCLACGARTGAFADGESSDGSSDSTESETGDSMECADPEDPNAPIETFDSGNVELTTDTTWTCDRIYRLQDSVVVVRGAVLTIEPGTTVQAASSALLIETDARLEAEGTAERPIVFTSAYPQPGPGDWGGILINGQAAVNLPGGFSNCGDPEAPPTPCYGGNEPTHDCGTLAYLRVEYAGFALSEEGYDLEAIGFNACGSNTTVHHVQVHHGGDDGIELRGGDFDLDHLVITGMTDDSIDFDQGFAGTIQHVFIHQNPTVGDNAFEISNQAMVFDALPLTSPTICNATVIGSGATGEKSKGFTVKEGTEASIRASIITDVTNEAGLLADEATWTVLDAGGITVADNIFFGTGATAFQSGAMSLAAAGFEAWVMDAANANLTSDPGLASTSWGSPDPTPSGEVGGNGEGCGGTDYIGAVDPTGENWTAEGWINYAP